MGNSIQKWIDSDKNLYNLIVEIQSSNKTPIEQAEMAMNRICELYDLPKMPDDIEKYEAYYEKMNILNPKSLFEENAIIKFLEPNDDPRGVLLAAAYNVKNNSGVDYKEVARKEFGKNIPENLQIGIIGEGIHGKIVFPNKEGKSWFELGCVVNTMVK